MRFFYDSSCTAAEQQLSPKQVRARFPHLHIGRSVHSLEEAVQAEKEDADYVLFGHVFETDCKKGLEGRGVSLLSDIKQRISVPVIAIGGMTPDRLRDVKRAGAEGIAVMSGIFLPLTLWKLPDDIPAS